MLLALGLVLLLITYVVENGPLRIYGFEARLGYLAGSSADWAFGAVFFLALFRLKTETAVTLTFAILAGLVWSQYTEHVKGPGFALMHETKRQPVSPKPSSPPAVSRSANTGQYFSSECRLVDGSPTAQAAYDAQLLGIERRFPRLNPDLGSFRADLEQLVVTRKEALERTGYSPCVAVRLAADEVMSQR
jgi:hypothetical protein